MINFFLLSYLCNFKTFMTEVVKVLKYSGDMGDDAIVLFILGGVAAMESFSKKKKIESGRRE